MDELDDDPIVGSVSSGYRDDPLACSWTRSGRRIWTYPEARAQFEAAHPEEAEAQRRFHEAIRRALA